MAVEETKHETVVPKNVGVKIDKLLPNGLNIDTSDLDMSKLQEDLKTALLQPVWYHSNL